MNIAHIAFYANTVLEDLNIETLTVGFWRGLYEGHGDASLVPDDLTAAEHGTPHTRIESVADAKAWLGEDHYLLKIHEDGHLTITELLDLARALQSAHIHLSRAICAVTTPYKTYD